MALYKKDEKVKHQGIEVTIIGVLTQEGKQDQLYMVKEPGKPVYCVIEKSLSLT